MQAWEREQAYQSYRQGERDEYDASAAQESKPWWQRAGDWLQQKVVQPVQRAVGAIVSALNPPQQTESSTLIAPAHEKLRWQWADDLWHKRSVRMGLVATAVAITAPALFSSINLATYSTFRVPVITWFGVGGDRKGVETAFVHRDAIADVVNNYNTAIASGATFSCAYNQKGKSIKECTRSVEIQPIFVEAAIAVQSQWKIP